MDRIDEHQSILSYTQSSDRLHAVFIFNSCGGTSFVPLSLKSWLALAGKESMTILSMYSNMDFQPKVELGTEMVSFYRFAGHLYGYFCTFTTM